MTRSSLRVLCLVAPAALALLVACNSQPTATDTEKTAVVVPGEANAAADSTATATGDSAATK